MPAYFLQVSVPDWVPLLFAQESRDEYLYVDGSKFHLKILGEEFRSKDLVTIVLDSGGCADATQRATLQPRLANELEGVVSSYWINIK